MSLSLADSAHINFCRSRTTAIWRCQLTVDLDARVASATASAVSDVSVREEGQWDALPPAPTY